MKAKVTCTKLVMDSCGLHCRQGLALNKHCFVLFLGGILTCKIYIYPQIIDDNVTLS